MLLEKQAQFIEVLELPIAEEHMVMEPENALTVEETPEAHNLSGLVEEGIEEPKDFEVVLDELPGVDELDPEFEKLLEVSEKDDTAKEDTNDADNKPKGKWDWRAYLKSKDVNGFFNWAISMLNDVPKHSGKDIAGLRRAKSFLDKFINEMSKAMEEDVEGILDANKIEKLCAEAEDGKYRLEDREEKIKNSKKAKRSKKALDEQEQLIKTAQKVPNVVGIVVSVPILISGIARVCINSMVSAGHDIEHIFDDQVKKYNLNEREQTELMFHLQDLGLPMYRDRGYARNEDLDKTDGKYDWMTNYQA